MKNNSEINVPFYDNLPFSVQRKLDQKAYSKYFNDNFDEKCTLTFNSWFGTIYHQKYINVLLRKYKLIEIKKNQ